MEGGEGVEVLHYLGEYYCNLSLDRLLNPLSLRDSSCLIFTDRDRKRLNEVSISDELYDKLYEGIAAPVPTMSSSAAPVPTMSSSAAPVPTMSASAAHVPTMSASAAMSAPAAHVPTMSASAAHVPNILIATAFECYGRRNNCHCFMCIN